jgi:hypothetical protein
VPLQAGHIVRSDIIPLRLQDSQHIETVVSFADRLQTFTSISVASEDADNIEVLFSVAAAGLIFTASSTEATSLSLAVDLELENRLSFP